LEGDRVAQEITPEEMRAQVIDPLADSLVYRMVPTIFGGPKFPAGSLEQGDLVRRTLGAPEIATTYYDAQFNEVKQPDKPGRYGAVVHIHFPVGLDFHRFITLYHLPEKANLRQVKFALQTEFSPDFGISPEVWHAQSDAVERMLKSSLDYSFENRPDPAVLLAWLSEIPAKTPVDPASIPTENRTAVSANEVWWHDLRQRLNLGETYPYLIHLPEAYDADPNRRWPLVVYLHGSGGRGGDLNQFHEIGPLERINRGKSLDAIIVDPQCPSNEWWNLLVISDLLDDLQAKYRVDPDRITMTGSSMGGFGTWAFAEMFPDKLAAIAPICGGGNVLEAAKLKHLPVWAFHGEKDPTVPVKSSIEMTAAVRQAGGQAHLTIYPGVGHDAWGPTYSGEEVYTWLLAQKRGQPEVVIPGEPTP
jgi:acetyl esterase/lipase